MNASVFFAARNRVFVSRTLSCQSQRCSDFKEVASQQHSQVKALGNCSPRCVVSVVSFVPCAHNSVGLCRAAEAPECAATGNVPTGYGDNGRGKYPA